MTKSQFDKLLLNSNEVCGFDDFIGYSRIVTHYDRDKDRTTLYCIFYEDCGNGYEPKLIEPLVKFHGKRILTFEITERIEDDENSGR